MALYDGCCNGSATVRDEEICKHLDFFKQEYLQETNENTNKVTTIPDNDWATD